MTKYRLTLYADNGATCSRELEAEDRPTGEAMDEAMLALVQEAGSGGEIRLALVGEP
jgi:hypothetical protein